MFAMVGIIERCRRLVVERVGGDAREPIVIVNIYTFNKSRQYCYLATTLSGSQYSRISNIKFESCVASKHSHWPVLFSVWLCLKLIDWSHVQCASFCGVSATPS